MERESPRKARGFADGDRGVPCPAGAADRGAGGAHAPDVYKRQPGTSGLRGRVFWARTAEADEARSRIAREPVSKRRKWRNWFMGLEFGSSAPSLDERDEGALAV